LQLEVQLAQALDHLSNRLNDKALSGVMRMFEGILLGLIVFAVGYTLAMRVMARRADVLHGEFIQTSEPRGSTTARTLLANIQRYLHGVGLSARR
jgi:hypothetical protein